MRNKNAVLISALVCTACLGIGTVTVPNVSDSLTSVVQADDAVYEGFLYSVSGGEATVTGYSENLDLTNVVIPDVIKEGGKEIPVTAIGDSAFAESKAVIITVGNNVKTIGNNAFASCTSLKELNLGKNTEAIGDNVLYSGYSEKMTITKLTVPDNLSVIGDNIYGEYGYTNVTELVVPASAEYIDSAFYTKASLKNITVDEKSTFFSSDKGVLYNKDKSTLIRCPQSTALKTYTVDSAVKTISGYAFYSCSNLQIITVNEAAESIGDYAFAECSGLTELTLGKNVTSIGECALTSSYGKSTTLSKLTLPDNLYIIGDNIYGEYGYTNVTELVVPASAEYIDGVFYNKGSLKNITVDEKNTLFSSDKGILYSKDKSTLIRCPQSTALKTYTVDSAVKTIESNAFNSCTNLQVITVNDTAESIGEYAFAYCSGLTELTLGKNVSSLGECAVTSNYGSNMKLSKLTIPDNLSVIGDNIYGEYGYTEVTELIVPASAEYIAGVFYKKGTLKNITVDENNAAYSSDKGVLYSKDKSTLIRCPQSTALKTYTVDSAVKTIESNAFNSCKNLQVITVNDTAESIGDYAFAYCQGLSELVLGKNVTSIGEGALASNYGSNMKLSKLTVPDNLSVIGDKIYGQYGYTEVTELIIPASAEYINNVFYTKSSLKNITVEENNKKYFSFGGALYSLESSALLKFPQSSDVLIYNIVTGTKSIAANAFTGTKLQSVLIPSTVKEIGENAFKGSALKTVRGTKGSYAETFAAENSYAFEEAADPDVKLPAASAVPSPVPTASASPTASPSPSASSSPSPVPTASPSLTPSAKPEGGNGDVDGDGKSTTTDVRKILQYLVGTVKFTDAQKTTADINGDKAVNSTDALLLLRKVAGVVSAE